MQLVSFHLMPYRPLDMVERHKHRAGWVVLPNSLYDPKKGADEYASYIDQLTYAEELGFDVVAVNEHHQTAYGLMPAPNLIASALIQRTKKVKIAILGRALPLVNNPINIAEEFAMLDNLSRGRIITGFVRGMQAFGLEESGDYGAAEAAGLHAVEVNPDDVWAVHAVVHVREMQGRVDDGIRFLIDREAAGVDVVVEGLRVGAREREAGDVGLHDRCGVRAGAKRLRVGGGWLLLQAVAAMHFAPAATLRTEIRPPIAQEKAPAMALFAQHDDLHAHARACATRPPATR